MLLLLPSISNHYWTASAKYSITKYVLYTLPPQIRTPISIRRRRRRSCPVICVAPSPAAGSGRPTDRPIAYIYQTLVHKKSTPLIRSCGGRRNEPPASQPAVTYRVLAAIVLPLYQTLLTA